MPLVQLVTDLKSLKYGKDTPGGGYSGQPYIQAKIPDGLEPKSPDFILRGGYLTVGDSLTDIKRLTKMFFDLKSPNGLFFIAKQNVLSNSAVRTQTSGVLNEGIYTPLNTLAEAGVIAFGGHLNKQGINPFSQTGAYAVGDGLYNSVVKPYQPLEENRLVQIYRGINENRVTQLDGFKFNEGGVNVLSYKGGPGAPLGIGNTNIRFADQRTGEASGINFGSYQKNLKSINFENKQVGGLQIDTTKSWTKPSLDIVTPTTTYKLKNTLPSFNVNSPQSGSLSKIPNGAETWKTKQNNPDSLKYTKTLSLIGDQSQNIGVSGKYFKLTDVSINNNFNFFGKQVGTYNHNVYTQGNTFPDNSPLIYANNTFTYTQKDLIKSNVNPVGEKTNHLSPKIQDFRKVLRNRLGENTAEGKKATNLGATPNTPNYSGENAKNIEKRVNIGSADGLGPGSRSGKSYASYTKGVQTTDGNGRPNGVVGAQDRINALPIYRSQAVNTNLPVDDLVKFRIAAIDGSNPNFKTFIHFRAFIDSFSDSYNASWGSVKYLGRGENFYNYNGFDRTISLSFTVAALSKPELIPMYKKLNYLASNLTPDYSPSGYMRGPLVQLTMGGYLYEQVGFITALTYDVPNDTTWEIGINTSGSNDNTVKELPHRITVNSFQFTPIHDFRPGKQGLGFAGQLANLNQEQAGGFVTQYGSERYIALANGEGFQYNNYDS